MPVAFASRLLKWYAAHGRDLPWRRTRDPYRIWISEVMLQQTRVETVIPYYRRWLRCFPSLRALAAASEQDVLAVWEGLGYYARARNLRRAAQVVVQQHGGRLPRTASSLRALPGVGAYTAAAVASIAFGEQVAALDGNIRRVLARVFDFRGDAGSPRGGQALQDLAQRHLPPGRASDYNQALMDLGALVCTPRAPDCPACPVRGLCQARRLGTQLERPMPRVRRPTPLRRQVAGVVHKAGRVLIVRRPGDRLLGGLWSFPGGAWGDGQSAPACLRRALRQGCGLEVQVGAPLATLDHAFTHFRLTQQVFDCCWRKGAAQPADPGAVARWVRVADLEAYPMGKVDRRIARKLKTRNE